MSAGFERRWRALARAAGRVPEAPLAAPAALAAHALAAAAEVPSERPSAWRLAAAGAVLALLHAGAWWTLPEALGELPTLRLSLADAPRPPALPSPALPAPPALPPPPLRAPPLAKVHAALFEEVL